MKVLMISTDWRIAVLGSHEHVRMSRYATVAEELHIIVFTLKEQQLQESMSGNLYIYPTNSSSKWSYGLDAIAISSRLKKRGITVVTAQDPFETGLAAYRIARKLRAGLQLQMHTDWMSPFYAAESFKNRLRVKIANYLVPKASGIRVVSRRLAYNLVQKFKLKNDPIVLPIHLEIPISMLSERRDILHQKYPRFATIIVMMCRLEVEKNAFMAINAFKNIIGLYSGAGLIIVGDGSSRPSLEKAVIASQLENNVIFEGWQDFEKVMLYFLSADLFINTSNYEGYGRTLIEAAAAGCPIVTTDVGVVGEVLNPDNALVSSPQDLSGFQKNLEYALKHPVEMKERALRAREAVTHYMSITENDRLQMLKRSWEMCDADK